MIWPTTSPAVSLSSEVSLLAFLVLGCKEFNSGAMSSFSQLPERPCLAYNKIELNIG